MLLIKDRKIGSTTHLNLLEFHFLDSWIIEKRRKGRGVVIVIWELAKVSQTFAQVDFWSKLFKYGEMISNIFILGTNTLLNGVHLEGLSVLYEQCNCSYFIFMLMDNFIEQLSPETQNYI